MFSDNEDIFCECDKCQSEIGFANRIWEISRSESRFVKNHGEIDLEPLKEEPLLILCAYCGSSSIDFKEIHAAISNHSEESDEIWDDETMYESASSLGYCDKCGTGIGIGEVVININCSTGQIECNSPGHDIPDYFVSDRAEICALCQDCGESSDLKGILVDTVVKNPFGRPYVLMAKCQK